MKKEKSKRPVRQKLRELAFKSDQPPAEPETVSETQLEAAFTPAYLRLKKPLLIIAVVFLVLIIGAATFISVARVSLAKVYVADIKINSIETQGQLQQEITTSAANYKFKLLYTNGRTKSYPLSNAGISVDSEASAVKAKRTLNHSFVSRFTWWRPIRLTLVTKVNKTKLADFITTKATVSTKAAQDANLSINDGAVSLIPEASGIGSAIKNPEATLLSTASLLSHQPLKLVATTLEPSINSKDLQASQIKAEKFLAEKVVLTISGRAITATSSDIGGWLDVSPVPSAKTVDVTVNSGKVLQYINRIARPYIHPPRSRLVTQLDGGQTVLDAGEDGFDVLDKDQTAASLAKAVSNGNGFSSDLPIAYASAQTVEVDPAPKWIVVDVTNKRMYAYEETTLVRSFLISAGAPRTPTVLGHYAVYSKYVKQDMRGANADGSRYFQPNVPHINYFYQDYAIHGNYWRPLSYFGNINSSHGCVGVVTADAAWIYNWAPVGTPVIVHK